MTEHGISRRDFVTTALATGAAMAPIGGMMTLEAGAQAMPGEPVPPISMMYYGNWPEIVELFRKAAQDLRKIGLTPKLNPAPSNVVVPRTLQQHDYGDWGSIMWGATPERLDPNFYLEDMLHSAAKRNYGHYKNPKYDAAVEAQ